MQVLEALHFLLDMVQTFHALVQTKFECQIQYCFSALNLTVEMSNETQFSIM